MMIDPDSVDVHDVTIAMAEANLSLKLAQSVIDRVIRSWNRNHDEPLIYTVILCYTVVIYRNTM